MRRRYFLSAAALGAFGGLAGCAGGGDGTPDYETESPTNTSGAQGGAPDGGGGDGGTQSTPEGTPTAGPDDITIQSTSFDIDEGEYSSTPYVTGEVTQSGSSALDYVELRANFYNESDELLDSNIGMMYDFTPDDVWTPYIEYFGDAEEAAGGDLEVRAVEVEPAPTPQSAELADHELRVPQDESATPSVVGSAENTGDAELGYLEARVKFYGDGNTVLTANMRNEVDLQSGRTWRFEIPYTTGHPKSALDRHKIRLAR